MITKRYKNLGIILSIVVIVSVAALLGYRLWTNRKDIDRSDDTKQNETVITERYEGYGLKSHETAEPGIYQQGPFKYTEEKGFVSEEIYTSWEELEAQGIVTIKNGVMYTVFHDEEGNYKTREHITGAVVLPNYVIAIEKDTFCDCYIKELVIPEGVKKIGADAFAGCSQLTRISLPRSLQDIGPGAFAGCGINSLMIPKEVKKIGSSAFFEIPHIEYQGTATYKKSEKYWGAESMN